MEGSGKYGTGASNGYRGYDSAGFRGQPHGEAYTRQGYQRPYQWYGAAGFHGSRGGDKRYDQHGRGFSGNFRQTKHRAAYSDQRPMTATLRDVSVNVHGHDTFQGGAVQRDQNVDVHG
jgi:hypothetical protein